MILLVEPDAILLYITYFAATTKYSLGIGCPSPVAYRCFSGHVQVMVPTPSYRPISKSDIETKNWYWKSRLVAGRLGWLPFYNPKLKLQAPTLKILDICIRILYSISDRAFRETGRRLYKLNLSGNRKVGKSGKLQKWSLDNRKSVYKIREVFYKQCLQRDGVCKEANQEIRLIFWADLEGS